MLKKTPSGNGKGNDSGRAIFKGTITMDDSRQIDNLINEYEGKLQRATKDGLSTDMMQQIRKQIIYLREKRNLQQNNSNDQPDHAKV